MEFLPELERLREQRVNDANWRTIETIDALFEKVNVPIERLRQMLLDGAKNIGAFKTQAYFYVPLNELLTYTPPLTLYTGYTQPNTRLFTLQFDTSLAYDMLNSLFRSTGIFLKLDAIRQKLSDTFPDGTITLSTCDFPTLSLQLLVEYQLKRPDGVVKIQ